MIEAFLGALANGNHDEISTGPDISLESHLMVFAAETARREQRVVEMQEFARG